MSYTGFPGGPPARSAVPFADFGTAIMGAYGAMLALFHKERTGVGQLVDVSLMDTALAFVAGMGVIAEYTLLNQIRPQVGNHSFYNYTDSFEAKDGWVNWTVIMQKDVVGVQQFRVTYDFSYEAKQQAAKKDAEANEKKVEEGLAKVVIEPLRALDPEEEPDEKEEKEGKEKDEDKEKLSTFMGAKIQQTSDRWSIIRAVFPNIFTEIIWNTKKGLDIEFSGENLVKKISSVHAEFIGIFTINHILRYITLNNLEKDLPDICYTMFSRYFTKQKKWNHRKK